ARRSTSAEPPGTIAAAATDVERNEARFMNSPFSTDEEYAVHDIDPTRSTDSNYPRSTFLGAAAAAAAGTATLGTAFAQTELGKPHPPLVPENDPSIATEH